MKNKNRTLYFRSATYPIAVLGLLFILTSCSRSEGWSILPEPTDVENIKDVKVEATTTPGRYQLGPDRDFDCSDVSQITPAECQALIALYESTGGLNWSDNAGWLQSNTPCTWSGITCTGDHISEIQLSFNQLRGILPPELGDLSELRVLALYSNQLHGVIPPELGDLPELGYLGLSSNLLTGPLPGELVKLGKLRSLELGFNQLGGTILPEIGNLTGLESLDLSHNQFSGPIPNELGHLGNLSLLQLSHNQLTGSIPTALGDLSKLSQLDLSYNQLQGAVPEPVVNLPQRALWGNQLDGTVTTEEQIPVNVDYMGIHFSADPALASSIWPEAIPGIPASEGEPFWMATPEHIRFTFADPWLPPGRSRMGINLVAEAQILIFPTRGLADIDPWGSEQVEKLQRLLLEGELEPAADFPMFPLNNAFQVFRVQAKYLATEDIQGLRYITQYTQDNIPAINNQDLFYTFQGLSLDGGCYVAGFFPLTTNLVSDKPEITENWESYKDNYENYISETTALLNQAAATEFTPDLTLLDSLITSMHLDSNGRSCNGIQSSTWNSPQVEAAH